MWSDDDLRNREYITAKRYEVRTAHQFVTFSKNKGGARSRRIRRAPRCKRVHPGCCTRCCTRALLIPYLAHSELENGQVEGRSDRFPSSAPRGVVRVDLNSTRAATHRQLGALQQRMQQPGCIPVRAGALQVVCPDTCAHWI